MGQTRSILSLNNQAINYEYPLINIEFDENNQNRVS